MSSLPLPAGRTAVMGIVNVTPDSFSDGGLFPSVGEAVAYARRLVAEGADLLDLGGESTRPGAVDVDPEEEIRRTVPVIEELAGMGVPVSIDTRKAAVAEAALGAGATIVNDVSAGTFDPEMLPLVADRGSGLILMHMRGTPQTMDSMTGYSDVVAEVVRDLEDRLAAALAAGVDKSRVAVDPGLGFAKTAAQSRRLVARIDEVMAIGLPVVVGPSRKRFIGGELEDRLEGTLAVVGWCVDRGVEIVRVHDVRAARRVVDMVAALKEAGS